MNLRWLLALCVLVFSVSAKAGMHVWTGAANDRFSDAGNWIGGSPAGDAEAELVFPAGPERVVLTNDITGLTVRTISFSGVAYAIGGSPITLTGGAEVFDTTSGPNAIACDVHLAGGATFLSDHWTNYSFNTPSGLEFSGVIGGTGPLTKVGSGVVIFSGSRPNTWSGLTRVLDGTLRLAKEPGVNAVPGDVNVSGTGFNGQDGTLAVAAAHQIPDTAAIRVGGQARFLIEADEIVGPLEVEGNAEVNGRLILTNDVTVLDGSSSSEVRLWGFALSGIRTIRMLGSTSVSIYRISDHTPGSGLILRTEGGAPRSLNIDATYFGPTIIDIDGSVRLVNRNTAVRLRRGTFQGNVASLAAEGGTVDGTSGGVTTTGDLRVHAAATMKLAADQSVVSVGGVLDLRRAKLALDYYQSVTRTLGATYAAVRNTGPDPVSGTFADVPEGTILSDRFRISYRGNDGNDITMTDVGKFASSTRLEYEPTYLEGGRPVTLVATVTIPQFGGTPTGTITFREGTTVLGTAPFSYRSSITIQPERGMHTYTATFESPDSSIKPSTGTVQVPVPAIRAELDSVEPMEVTSGTTVELILRGSGFLPGGEVVIDSKELPSTFISPSEVRATWNVYHVDFDAWAAVMYRQPGPGAVPSPQVQVRIRKVVDPYALLFEPSAVSGRVTPGGNAVWFSTAYLGGGTYASHAEIMSDSDGDGVVRWAQVNGIPSVSLWLLIDTITAKVSGGRPNGSPAQRSSFPTAMFLRDEQGRHTYAYLCAGFETHVLWIRPNQGAWFLSGFDGSNADIAEGRNGCWMFRASQMYDIIGSPSSPPQAFERGDIVVGIERTFDFTSWFGDRIDQHLAESDGPGTIAFGERTEVGFTDEGATQRMPLLRTGGTDGQVSVDYTTVDGTAKAGLHYVPASGRVTFGPGEVQKFIEVRLLNAGDYAGGARFKVVLQNPARAAMGDVRERVITINDHDEAPMLSVESVTVPEGDEGLREVILRVTISRRASIPITVNWSSHGQSTNASGTLTFLPGGPLTQTISVRVQGDRISEDDGGIEVVLRAEGVVLPPTVTGRVTIKDDDFATLSIVDTTVSESRNSVTLLLVSSGPSQKDIAITYTTVAGTATAGEDFTTTTRTLTIDSFAAVTVPIVADSAAEGLETFTIVLSDVKGARIQRGTATVTILDDDSAALPVLRADPVTVQESGDGVAVFRVYLSFPARTEVSVRARAIAGTAAERLDFEAYDRTLVIPAGQTESVVGVKIVKDFDVDPSETFELALSDVVGATIGTPSATATIVDDDLRFDPNAVAIEVAGAPVTEGTGGTTPARFSVRLSRAGSVPVTVQYATTDGDATAPADYAPLSGTMTFAPGETVKFIDVNINADTSAEPDETFRLVVGNATNATIRVPAAVCRVINDDTAPEKGRAVRH